MIFREDVPERDRTDQILKEAYVLLNKIDRTKEASLLDEIRAVIIEGPEDDSKKKEVLFTILERTGERASQLLSVLRQMPIIPWETLQAGFDIRYDLEEPEIAPEQYFYSDGQPVILAKTYYREFEKNDRLMPNQSNRQRFEKTNQRIHFLGVDKDLNIVVELDGQCIALEPEYFKDTYVKFHDTNEDDTSSDTDEITNNNNEIVYHLYRNTHDNFEAGDELVVNDFADLKKMPRSLNNAGIIYFLGIDRYNNVIVVGDGKRHTVDQADFDTWFKKIS